MDGIISTIKANWAVIANAPWAFATVTIVIIAAVWFGVTYLKAHQLADLEGRLKLRDDEIADYKRKLSGASPDEAKARVDELERQVASLLPRRLRPEQKEALAHALEDIPARHLAITVENSAPELAALARDIRGVFNSAGWQGKGLGMVFGPSKSPPGGFLLSYMPHLADDGRKLAEAFTLAGFPVEVEETPRSFEGFSLQLTHPHMD